MTQDEKMRERARKGIARCVSDGRWSWRATHFESSTYWGLRGTSVFVNFIATFHYVKVIVRGEYHNLPNEEKTFTGDEALNDAIIWAADKYLEMHYTVQARLAPFVTGQERYDRAYRGVDF